jgi:hypothetical protein
MGRPIWEGATVAPKGYDNQVLTVQAVETASGVEKGICDLGTFSDDKAYLELLTKFKKNHEVWHQHLPRPNVPVHIN